MIANIALKEVMVKVIIKASACEKLKSRKFRGYR